MPGWIATQHRIAAEADSRFLPANRAVFRMLLQNNYQLWEPSQMLYAVKLTVAHGNLDVAEEYLRKMLRNQELVSRPGFEKVLVGLMHYSTAKRVGPEEFRRSWAKDLEDLRDLELVNPGTLKGIDEIFAAYEEDFPIEFNPGRFD